MRPRKESLKPSMGFLTPLVAVCLVAHASALRPPAASWSDSGVRMVHPTDSLAVSQIRTPPLTAAKVSRAAVLRSAVTFVIGEVAISRAHAVTPPDTAKNAPPPVKGLSTPEQIALAQHLKAMGAKFYGAYWCPYCTLQREMFGTGAAPR